MPELKESRIHWTQEEWDLLAQELWCIRPIAQYQQSDSLASLTLADMEEVQKVLPKYRQRNLQTVTIVRPKMQEAMRRLRVKIKEAEERKALEEKVQAERQAAMEAAEREAAKPNPYEAALGPLVALITGEVQKQVQAMLNQAIAKAVAEATHQAQPQVENIAVTPPTFEETPKRLKFGVIGPLGVQAEDIKRAFPNVDFVTVESSQQRHAVSRVVGCDAIIGMTDFMDRSIDSQMRSKFLDNYHRAPGSTSSVKRLVGVLLSNMKHQHQSANMH